MSARSKGEKPSLSEGRQKKKDRAAEIANTFEWLITAFILAFVFRAFVMEAFRIPTGSMADTLKGAHFRLRCLRCGYKYNYGFEPKEYGLGEDRIPPGSVRLLDRTCCPSCGNYVEGRTVITPVANGDRILVLKCMYQFFEPKRWDVIVFKNPGNPSENYIKRLVGLPGEEVEIIDGDIYINGRISRKPLNVQDVLWMPVYDNDYQPVARPVLTSTGSVWQQPFRNGADSKWILEDERNPTVFRLDSPPDQINWLVYETSNGNSFRATYAYDPIGEYEQPECSDLMVCFYAGSSGAEGRVGIALGKYQTIYKGWVDLTGEMVVTKASEGEETILVRKTIEPPVVGKFTLVKFANVDHRLIFQFGGEELTYDLGRLLEDVGPRRKDSEPVKIFGSGELRLSHISIFRDIHYTSPPRNDGSPCFAAEDHPFKLGPDEFFVLGDNSPRSADSRLWERPQKSSKASLPPRQGVVPRDYLVGKALFVYWPSGFEFPWPRSIKAFLSEQGRHNNLFTVVYWVVSLRWIPNIGQMRFIYGGSNDKSHIAEHQAYLDQDMARAANDKTHGLKL